MVSCCAWGCSNRSERGARMYGFPSDAGRRKKWLAKLSRKNFTVDKNYNSKKICEVHFEADQFVITKKGKTRLRSDAIPTVFAHRPVVKRRKAPTPRGIQHLVNIEAIAADHSYSIKEERGDEVTRYGSGLDPWLCPPAAHCVVFMESTEDEVSDDLRDPPAQPLPESPLLQTSQSQEEQLKVEAHLSKLNGLQDGDIIAFIYNPPELNQDPDQELNQNQDQDADQELNQNQDQDPDQELNQNQDHAKMGVQSKREPGEGVQNHHNEHNLPEKQENGSKTDDATPVQVSEGTEEVNPPKTKTKKISNFGCSICERMFKNLKLHMMRHTGRKAYQCSVFLRRFYISSQLAIHRTVHSGKRPFRCPLCDRVFRQKLVLKAHLPQHTGKGFESSECGIKYSVKDKLTGPRKKHIQDKPYSCSFCCKMFETLEIAEEHLQIHQKEAKFQDVSVKFMREQYLCSECCKVFNLKQDFDAHMQVHSKEKPFICDVCGLKYKSIFSLNVHMKLHTGEKSFSCSVCGAEFSQKRILQNHESIHTGERPFVCSLCPKNNKTKSAL